MSRLVIALSRPLVGRRVAALNAVGALAALVACSDGTTEVRGFPLTVTVEYPAGYAQPTAPGARVILTSTERNVADTVVADAQGVATFTRVVPGPYTLTASRALAADEAFALTGQRTAVTLNASLPTQTLTAAPATPLRLRLAGARLGDLVIKEVYYAGSRTPAGGAYFADQFVELYNNSTDTLYTDSLVIAEVFGASGQVNPTTTPTPFQSDASNVYVVSAWMIPGTGRQRPLAPGRSLVIAQDGINHRGDPNGNPASPVDLSSADWETFNQRDDGRDVDAPNVPNLVRLRHDTRFDWNVAVFGPALVVLRIPAGQSLQEVGVPGTTTGATVARVPTAWVLDGFEALQNGSSGPYKRLPAAIDAGFVFASGTYTGQSARRRVAATVAGRRVLQDGNNTTADFETIATPTPRAFGATTSASVATMGAPATDRGR